MGLVRCVSAREGALRDTARGLGSLVHWAEADLRTTVRVWFDKAGHWWIRFEDGTTEKASEVHLDNAVTRYKEDGFGDLQPGGPRGVMVGELVAWTNGDEIHA